MVNKAELERENEELHARIQELEEAQEASSTIRTETPAPQSFQKEPKISEPPEFTRRVTKYAAFITHCDLYIRLKPITFVTEFDKVAFVISRLRPGASDWGLALLQSGSPLLESYEAFKAEMSSIYSDKQRLETLRNKLTKLKQTGSAASFCAEFKSLTTILGINNAGAIPMFWEKLKPSVKRGLALIPNLNTLDEFIDNAIRIDQINFNLDKAESPPKSKSSSNGNKPSSGGTSSNSASASRSSHSSSTTKQASSKSSYNSSSVSSEPHPSLTQEEKDRRSKERLCGYCASPDHIRRNCPKLLAKLRRQETYTQRPSLASTSTIAPTQVITPTGPETFCSGKPGSHNQ